MELRIFLLIMWRKRCLILAAFLSTLLATSIFTFLQTPIYEATSTFVVSPTGTYADAESLAGVLDSMSRRAELANTYAEVAASRTIKQVAADELDLSEAQQDDLHVTSKLVAGTNVLEITVQGSDAELVWAFADQVGVHTANYTRAMYESYGLRSLDLAVLPTDPVKPSKLLNLATGAFLGLALGVGLALLIIYLEAPQGEVISYVSLGAQPESIQQGAAVRSRSFRLRAAGWIVVLLLTLAVLGMGSMLFLSGPQTSASVLPVSRPVATFVPAAVRTPVPTMLPSPTPCGYPLGWVAYEVQVNDTLSSLAARHGMSVAEIVDANCLTRRVISAGQMLYFPPPETPAPTPTITATESVTLTLESTVFPTETVTPTPENLIGAIESVAVTTESVPVTTESVTVITESVTVTTEDVAPTPELSPTSEGSTRSTPQPTATANVALPAPVLIAPADGADFSASSEIDLAWRPVAGLPVDAFYVITVAYAHNGETWYDEVPWTRNTNWTLSEHDYLLELSDDGWFRWSVQVVRRTGIGADGSPEGVTLGEPSATWRLNWKPPASGGSKSSTPAVPPP